MSNPDDAQQLVEAFDRLTSVLTAQRNNSASSINVNAGGASVWGAAWIAGLCCAFMVGAGFVGGFWMLDATTRAAQERAELRKRDADFQDYLSAIYQAAPELQKRIEAQKAEESK